jgi:glycosyltransferase involved in cell wall biosynthesis
MDGRTVKICQLCAVDFTLYHFLTPLMAGQRDAGHEVVGVCADGDLVDQVRAQGFRVETVGMTRQIDLGDMRRAYRELVTLFRAERFDMVHVHSPIAALIGRAAAWRAGVPRIIYTAHGFYFHDRMPWLKRTAHIALEWLCGRVTDTLFTQAKVDAAAARRYGLCRTGDILAIGNGSDPAIFHPGDAADRKRIRETLGTADSRCVILMVGRLVREKGYPELIEAMRHVDAELWAVGDRLVSDHNAGIDSHRQVAAADPVLRQRVRFLGYRGDVADLMRAADLFVLPSHREGMPRSIVEAMLSGLPVVATDIRGSNEAVIDGQTGTLVPVSDPPALAAALNGLVTDPALRERYGAAGLKSALATFDEAVVVRRQIDHLGLAVAG